jgi:hypothetical protein
MKKVHIISIGVLIILVCSIVIGVVIIIKNAGVIDEGSFKAKVTKLKEDVTNTSKERGYPDIIQKIDVDVYKATVTVKVTFSASFTEEIGSSDIQLKDFISQWGKGFDEFAKESLTKPNKNVKVKLEVYSVAGNKMGERDFSGNVKLVK